MHAADMVGFALLLTDAHGQGSGGGVFAMPVGFDPRVQHIRCNGVKCVDVEKDQGMDHFSQELSQTCNSLLRICHSLDSMGSIDSIFRVQHST